MKSIQISPLTLIATLLILVGIILLIYYYADINASVCIRDPVAYANNHSKDYWWDYVIPIRIK